MAARNIGHVGARLKALYVLMRITGSDFAVIQVALMKNLSHGGKLRQPHEFKDLTV